LGSNEEDSRCKENRESKVVDKYDPGAQLTKDFGDEEIDSLG
jgi:hypothetical protein